MLMVMERVATPGAVVPVSIRPLALPAEHGGWGFVLVLLIGVGWT